MRIISGAYRGRSLKTTTGPGFRPAMARVREALFSMLEARGVVWPETRVLDLFAGSGSLGFEALSRGAAHVTFVESAPYAVKIIAANAELLAVPPGRLDIRRQETAKALALCPAEPYQMIFIDPPYQLPVLGATLQGLMKNRWAAPGALINAEVESRAAFDPEKGHPDLEFLTSRAYGQTRVILWRAPLKRDRLSQTREYADNGLMVKTARAACLPRPPALLLSAHGAEPAPFAPEPNHGNGYPTDHRHLPRHL